MRNVSSGALFAGFLAICLAIYLAIVVVAWLGLPLALLGLAVAYYFNRKFQYADDAEEAEQQPTYFERTWIRPIVFGSLTLAALSVAANTFTGSGPLPMYQEAKAAALAEAEKAERDRITDEQRQAELEADARDAGVSVAVYERLDDASSTAHTRCRQAARDAAAWTVKNSGSFFSMGYSWSVVDNETIRIRGDDLTMTNGFGAEKEVEYLCNYHIGSETARLLSVY